MLLIAFLILGGLAFGRLSLEQKNLTAEKAQLLQDQEKLQAQTENLIKEIADLKGEDLRKTNEGLKNAIKEVEKSA